MQTAEFTYAGSELALFAQATNWKRYFSSQLQPFITGDVLEVGAGMGETTRYLCDPLRIRSWQMLEPDISLATQAEASLAAGRIPNCCFISTGTLSDLASTAIYDTILYIDVIEHIEGDRAELIEAARHLRPNGRIILLAPAHQLLFSRFDAAVGHFRRYSRRSLESLAPPKTVKESSFYLDSCGLLASVANRALLRQDSPTSSQIAMWDQVLVRASRWIDPLLLRRIGKTVVAVFHFAGESHE